MFIPKTDWNRATYRELRDILNELPEHYLDQTATVCTEDEEYVGFNIAFSGEANQVLDPDHLFFRLLG